MPLQVGRAHPQALIYPITLAANSTNEARKDAALTIMADMRTHSPLVREGLETIYLCFGERSEQIAESLISLVIHVCVQTLPARG